MLVACLLFSFAGFVIGFLGGRLTTDKNFNEESYSHGFTHGYDVAKDNFYNPNAKG